MKKENTVIVGLAILAALGAATWLLFAAPELATGPSQISQGATSPGTDVYGLQTIILWICVTIGMGVIAAMLASIVLHRKMDRHRVVKFNHSVLVEIIWALVPILILVGMALPATTELLLLQNTPPQLPVANVKLLPGD